MKYIALLRGINVSGQKKVPMAALRDALAEAGLNNIATYIQSGNVVFDHAKTRHQHLKQLIEKTIEKTFHFDAPVTIRTHKEIATTLAGLPFKDINETQDSAKILVSFLSRKVERTELEPLIATATANEQIGISNNNLYLYCPEGYGKSRLSNNFIEKKLKLGATTRNWKTVKMLYEMSIPETA